MGNPNVLTYGKNDSGVNVPVRVNSDGGILTGTRTVVFSGNFTRPADTTTYAQYDAITDSTSAPTVLTLTGDITVPNAAMLDIRAVQVNTSTKPSGTKLQAVAMLFPATFTATNDNAELSVDDVTARGGVMIRAVNQFQTALNYRVASDPGSWLFKCAAADNKIYVALMADNAWVPGNADRIDVSVRAYLLG